MDRMHEPASAVSDEPAADAPEVPSFEAFFEAEHGRLLRALYLVTGNAEEAEELMQDAFVAVWERWDRVRTMDEPTGYLFRTAMNRYRSRLRRTRATARRRRGRRRDAFAAAEERDAVARALAAPRTPARRDRPHRAARLRLVGGRADPRRKGRDRSFARVAGEGLSAEGIGDRDE